METGVWERTKSDSLSLSAADKCVAGERDLGIGNWGLGTNEIGQFEPPRAPPGSKPRTEPRLITWATSACSQAIIHSSYRPQCAPHPHPTTTTVSCAPPFQVIGLGPTRDLLQNAERGVMWPNNFFFYLGCVCGNEKLIINVMII